MHSCMHDDSNISSYLAKQCQRVKVSVADSLVLDILHDYFVILNENNGMI
jgi:hypothetical protein